MKWKLNQHNVDAAAANKKNLKIDKTSIWSSISVEQRFKLWFDRNRMDNNNNFVFALRIRLKNRHMNRQRLGFLANIFVNARCN